MNFGLSHILSSLSLAFVLTILSSCSDDQNLLLEKGISKELATFRKSSITDINYDLSFNIPASKANEIEAKLILKFNFANDPTDIILDFNAPEDLINQVTIDGQVINAQIINEHIIIPSKYLAKSNTIEIEFTAGELSLNRHDDYLFTLFVPERASTCFPLFDQPNLKATYKLKLIIPESWEAVSNGMEKNVTKSESAKTIEFEETLPISSYLFAFAAGEFEILERTIDGQMMRMFHRESDTLALQRNAEEIFQQHKSAINWLEEYSAIQYPFPKFDFVLIPSFQYGGMEHPGAVFYKASSLLLGENSTLNEQMGRARLIAHETAHMWFGDLVTMPWFNDVWLKEVFANFMAAKIVNPQFPQVNHDLQFLMTHYPAAYEVDRTKGTHSIAQDLNNLKNAGSLYGAIIYQKAPIVMRMLEQKIGDSIFQEGIREYLNNYQFANASWDNLIEILSKKSQKNLFEWDERWVKSVGMPTVLNRLRFGNTRLKKLMLINKGHGENDFWPQTLELGMINSDSLQLLSVDLNTRAESVRPDSILNPDYIFTNYGGMGYGYFTMGPESKEYFLANIQNHENLVRGALWINYFEMMLRNNLSSEVLVDAILREMVVEKEAIIVDYLNTCLETIFWRIFTSEQREKYAPKIESVILNMAINGSSDQIKSTFFKTFYKVALTPHSVDLVKQIWEHETVLEGVELSENDYITLAYELAVRSIDSADFILSNQLERVKNKDRKERMQWIANALNHNKEVREEFFESLKDEVNRENEEWVLEAMKYLNHPLRAPESDVYILPSLELLEEIKLTGDIFFPKRWLDAVFRGHQSEEAADKVRQFLYKHNKYPTDLKNKILQSSDILFRSVQIQEDLLEKAGID